MRPRTPTFALNPQMSPGLPALRRQLAGAGADASPEVLGPVSALRELEAICSGMLAGRGGPQPGNRRSLVDDARASVKALGRAITAAIGPALTDFHGELTKTQQRLDIPQGARVINLALTPLLERLSTEAVLRAAWRDVVAAFQDVSTSAEMCELRLLQLAELAEHGGVDLADKAAFIELVLSDDVRALGMLSEPTNPDRTGRFGGVSEERRLELCERIISAPEPRSDIAVWLVIHAALEPVYLSLGPVQFFAGDLWPDILAPGGGLEQDDERFTAPPELADRDQALGGSAAFPRLGIVSLRGSGSRTAHRPKRKDVPVRR